MFSLNFPNQRRKRSDRQVEIDELEKRYGGDEGRLYERRRGGYVREVSFTLTVIPKSS